MISCAVRLGSGDNFLSLLAFTLKKLQNEVDLLYPLIFPYPHFLSPAPGEAPPKGSRQVSAAVQTESCSQGTGPSPGQGQGELHGGDPEA